MKKWINSNAAMVVSALLCIGALVLLWQQVAGISFADAVKKTRNPGTLSIEGPDSVGVSQPFEVSIILDTKNQPVNAAGVFLRFEPSKLQLLKLDTKDSFCQFYPEKKHDNNLGTISLACGSPHPGFKGVNQILKLQFMPLIAGSTSISTDPKSQLLLSDGKGTDILEAYPQKSITITTSF